MRLVVAMMSHETNTFSPVPTPLARFSRGGASGTPLSGEAALAAYRNTGTAIGAFIELAEAEGAEIVAPLAAGAWPSGPVEDAAWRYMADRVCEAVAAGCDGALLQLHGAMATESLEDGEGALLARLRALAPSLPIAVSLDMHANVYPAIVENADIVAGYRTYPHVDVHETGMRAGRAFFRMVRGEAAPAMAWGNRPMLPHVMRQGSDDSPNREIQALAREMEAEGALCASFFTGFPHADIELAGSSAVVVTDGDRALAEEMRDRLLDLAWRERAGFVYRVEPLEASLARAARLRGDGPVVLLDHYDNAASGGSMDCMTVLKGVLEAGLEDVAAFAVCDPAAARAMAAAGTGAGIELDLGGKTDMPAIGRTGEPLRVAGTVRAVSDGRFRNIGPMSKGVMNHMGPSAVLDTGKAEIAVISTQQEPNDFACFQCLGIDPRAKRYLVLKSRIHWRAGFAPIAGPVVECAGTGVCTSDYADLEFRRLRRPIYPLDEDARPVSTA